ncbi:MAG: sialidase family protein [Actinomycetota bacterium]
MVLSRRFLAFVALSSILTLALTAHPRSIPAADASDEGSGGKAVAHRDGGARVGSQSAQDDAPTSHLSRITIDGLPINGVEPTLGLTKSGDIFYTAFQGNTRIEVAHSGDEGKTWDLRSPKIGERNAHLLSVDPYLYVDKDTDRIFNIDLTLACSYLSFSDDKGKSWITNPLACGRPVNDHQTLFTGPPVSSPTVGYENIVYYCWNDVGSSSCSKSLDGGLTFHPTGSPAFTGVDPNAGGQGGAFCGGLHGHGFVGSDGTLLLPKGHCRQPWLAISRDEGRTWTRVQVANNGVADHESDAVMDDKGNIYYIYIARDRLPYLVVSTNGGKKWSKPMMVGPPGLKEANLPAMDVGGVGKVAFVYMGSENSPYRPNAEDQRSYSKTTWNGYMGMTANALDEDPLFFTGTVNDKRDPLIRDTCGPGRCRAVYDFIDVVVHRDGTPWAAFVDGCVSLCSTTGPSNIGSEAIVGHLTGGPRLK